MWYLAAGEVFENMLQLMRFGLYFKYRIGIGIGNENF